MSLIMDATRAAQREKERREGGGPGTVPVLVPLRTKARSTFSWQRMSIVATVGVAAVAAGAIILDKTRDTVPRALRTPGPTVVSLATPAPTAEPGREIARDTVPAARDSTTAATAPAGPVPAAAATPAATKATRPASAGSAQRVARSAEPPRGAASLQQKAPDQSALGQLRIAVAQPRELEAARLFAAGVAAHRNGDLEAARTAYVQALALVPTDADALNNLGVLLSSLKQYDQAEAVLRRAVALAPSNAGAWNNLGTVLRERGRSAEAIAAFQRALAIDPRHDGARVSLAQQYIVIGSLAQARQLLEDVLSGNPSLPEASYALGQVLERLGDRAGAIRAYSTFIRVAPPGLAGYVEPVRRRVEALSAQAP